MNYWYEKSMVMYCGHTDRMIKLQNIYEGIFSVKKEDQENHN